MYRLVSLWLNASTQIGQNELLIGASDRGNNNGSGAGDTLFTPSWLSTLDKHLSGIRVDKFLPLFPQLLVRSTTPAHEEGRGSRSQAAFHSMLSKVRLGRDSDLLNIPPSARARCRDRVLVAHKP